MKPVIKWFPDLETSQTNDENPLKAEVKTYHLFEYIFTVSIFAGKCASHYFFSGFFLFISFLLLPTVQ